MGSTGTSFDRGLALQTIGRGFAIECTETEGLTVATGFRGIAVTVTRVPVLLEDEDPEVDKEEDGLVIFAKGGIGR